ncbi:hypothetical protein VTH06DRAFT_5602 [Thermothelomyces fergusii]
MCRRLPDPATAPPGPRRGPKQRGDDGSARRGAPTSPRCPARPSGRSSSSWRRSRRRTERWLAKRVCKPEGAVARPRERTTATAKKKRKKDEYVLLGEGLRNWSPAT